MNETADVCTLREETMRREIRLNAFITNSAVHLSPGLWRHPRDRALGHNRLPFWLDLARLVERGLFDALFIADAIGVSGVYGGSQDMSIRYGLRVPRHDPFLVVPVMATVTEHLGFGITGTLSYEPPFLFARRPIANPTRPQGCSTLSTVSSTSNRFGPICGVR